MCLYVLTLSIFAIYLFYTFYTNVSCETFIEKVGLFIGGIFIIVIAGYLLEFVMLLFHLIVLSTVLIIAKLCGYHDFAKVLDSPNLQV